MTERIEPKACIKFFEKPRGAVVFRNCPYNTQIHSDESVGDKLIKK